MIAIILLSAVVEAARGRYRSPSPAKREQIAEREASQIARIDTERATFETLKAEHEKAQAALMAAQAKFEHEQNQLHLLRQYTAELTELQKASEQNAEQIDAVVQKIQALNLAGLQEATHDVKVAQAETVQAAQEAGQPVPPAVAEAAVEADKAFVEAAHAATEGGAPAAPVETPAVTTVPVAEPAPMVAEQDVAAPGMPSVVAETPAASVEAAPAPMAAPVVEAPVGPTTTGESTPVAAS